jgi:hypothetical protein
LSPMFQCVFWGLSRCNFWWFFVCVNKRLLLKKKISNTTH